MQQKQIQKQNQQLLLQEQEQQLKLKEAQVLRDMYSINDQSANSLIKLHDQGAKIDRVEGNLDQNQQKLHKIDYILDVIKSPWGQFKAIFKKPKKEQEQKQEKQQANIQQPKYDDPNHIYDEMLNQTNQMKYQQQLINHTIVTQNQQLDRINNKADKQTMQMAKQNDVTKKIIK